MSKVGNYMIDDRLVKYLYRLVPLSLIELSPPFDIYSNVVSIRNNITDLLKGVTGKAADVTFTRQWNVDNIEFETSNKTQALIMNVWTFAILSLGKGLDCIQKAEYQLGINMYEECVSAFVWCQNLGTPPGHVKFSAAKPLMFTSYASEGLSRYAQAMVFVCKLNYVTLYGIQDRNRLVLLTDIITRLQQSYDILRNELAQSDFGTLPLTIIHSQLDIFKDLYVFYHAIISTVSKPLPKTTKQEIEKACIHNIHVIIDKLSLQTTNIPTLIPIINSLRKDASITEKLIGPISTSSSSSSSLTWAFSYVTSIFGKQQPQEELRTTFLEIAFEYPNKAVIDPTPFIQNFLRSE